MTRRIPALALLLALLLSGCATRPVEKTVFAMDTVMTLRIWGSEAAASAAAERLYQLDAALSVTREDSEIAALNRQGSAELSPETAALLRQSLDYCALTEGALDLTIEPVAACWGFTTGDYRLPDAVEIAAALATVDYRALQWDGDRLTLPSGGGVTLGAVAKGYAADQLVALLEARGVTAAVLSLGGNVQTLGTRPDGAAWRVAIRDPADSAGQIGVLEIEGTCAVVTSGGYQRCFESGGEIYHHLLDPATGYPARSGLSSVTIVADSGLYADALSTAVYVMGADAALALWRQQGDFQMVLVTDEGRILATPGLTLLEAEAEVIS